MELFQTKKRVIKNILAVVSLAAIVVWPLYNSFLGLDLVDTGYYLYQYDTPLSSYGTYTTYLATLIGAVWLKLFPGLGLWGLNLLEVLLEWLTCAVVYNTFKNRFGKTTTLFGTAITMLAISTYVNIFNYHQLNMFLCCAMLCFMYSSLSKNKAYLMFISGCFGAIAVTCRMPSILTLLCVFCIFYWNIWVDKNRKNLAKRCISFFSGYAVVAVAVVAFLYAFGLMDTIIGEVFRLKDLGGTSSAAYGTSSMMGNLIRDTLWGLAASLTFTVCMVGFAAVCEWTSKKWGKRAVLLGLYTLLMLPVLYLAVYKIGQAPAFIQLTSFSWFLYGMCVEICLYYMLKGIIKPTKRHAEEGTLAMMSIALILLCVVGSAARSKHVILGLWILVPFVGNKFKNLFCGENKIHSPSIKGLSFERLSAKSLQVTSCLVMIAAVACFGRFLSVTNNFDSTYRSTLTATVDSERAKYIHTTQREADAVNGVLDALNDSDRSLMVVGNAVGFYYLTGMDSYVRPWVSGTSYTYQKFANDLVGRTSTEEKRPIVLVCKTNPYRGFAEWNYEELKSAEDNNTYEGKRNLVNDFMNHYEYTVLYENDYFILYEPNTQIEMNTWTF